ncbi:MAG TPA: hypothetical protein VIK32_01350, partial [Candidatus Limnocylindrales bacterium]
MRAHRPITCSVLGGLLGLMLVVGVSAAAAASATSQAARSVRISASLTEPSFAPGEVNSARLLYRFSSRSTSFSYRVSRKTRSGWQTVKSVRLRGSFSGSRNIKVGSFFPRRKATLGHYRIQLSAGGASTTLQFDVVKALNTTTVPVAAADKQSCALLSDSKVECWGDNSKGQLGNRTTNASPTPVLANGIKQAKAVSSEGFNTCTLVPAGVVKCWGDNANGKLGSGLMSPSLSSVPVTVSGIVFAVAVSTGFDHSCALLSGGTVRCWGRNNSGDVGGSKGSNPVPINVNGIRAIAISAGYRHSCAVLAGGKVACWGNNHFGQLG